MPSVIGGNQAGAGQHAIGARAHTGGIVLRRAAQNRFGMRLETQLVNVRIFICRQLRQLSLQRVQAHLEFFAGGHGRIRRQRRHGCGKAVKDVRSLALQCFIFLPVTQMKTRSTLTTARR